MIEEKEWVSPAALFVWCFLVAHFVFSIWVILVLFLWIFFFYFFVFFCFVQLGPVSE